jgi:uncharacterized membrane protein
VAWLIIEDFVLNTPRYGAQFIGRLGWLDTELPAPLILGLAALLVVLTLCELNQGVTVRWWQRCLFAVAACGSIAAIGGAMYILMGRIEGIQGRYFIPISLAAAWLFQGNRRLAFPASDSGRILVMMVTVSCMVGALVAVALRYYGEPVLPS